MTAHLQYLPACLLRSCENREVEEAEEPFPRGKNRAAPLTVRKLSLMLDRGRERRLETSPRWIKHLQIHLDGLMCWTMEIRFSVFYENTQVILHKPRKPNNKEKIYVPLRAQVAEIRQLLLMEHWLNWTGRFMMAAGTTCADWGQQPGACILVLRTQRPLLNLYLLQLGFGHDDAHRWRTTGHETATSV